MPEPRPMPRWRACAALCGGLWLALVPSDGRAQPARDAASLEGLSLEELLDVEVTSATKSVQSLAEAPAIVTVISAGQIRDRGYRSVGEALRGVPGLDLLRDHYQFNLGVRGVSPGARAWSRSVKVMIDGQPVSFRPTQEAWLGAELIPIDVVERIEVIKGPASVLYGANAYLGVVNIITKNGEAAQYGKLGAHYGVGPRLSDPGGSAMVGGATTHVDAIAAGTLTSPARVGYGIVQLPGVESDIADQRSESGQPISGSGFAKLRYDVGELGSLSFDFHFQQLERYTEFMDWGPMAHDNLQSLYNLYGRVRYTQTFLDALDWNLGVALSSGAPRPQDRLNVSADVDTHIEREVSYRGYDVFSNLTYRFGALGRVSLGADFTLDDQRLLNYYTVRPDGIRTLNPPSNTRTGNRNFSNVGVYLHSLLFPFARSSIDAMRDFELIAGLRYDHQNIYGDNFNYSAGLVHQLPRNLYAKLLLGSSFKAPSSAQLYSNIIDTGGVVGNPNLTTERARTLDFALGGTVRDHLTFEVTAFYTRVAGAVQVRPLRPALFGNPTPQNLADIDSFGGEAATSLQVGDFSAYANYSYQHSTTTEPNPFAVRPDQVVTQDTLLYPSHMVKLGLNYKVPVAFLQANLEGRYVSERLGSQSNNELVYGVLGVTDERYGLDPYFILDLYVSSYGFEPWHGRETRLGLEVNNLLGASYAFPGYQGFDIPGFVRGFVLSVSQEF